MTSHDTTLSLSEWSRQCALIRSVLEHAEHSFEDGITRRSPASQSARIRRHVPHCGGWLVCRAVAPFRVVKMRRRSFTSRFASKTIRSLAHFHDAGDEGNALVMIRRQSRRLNAAAIRGPRRKYFRWGKDVRPRKPNETLSRHERRARRVALLAPRAMFSLYCSPLKLVSARLKLFSRDVFIKA